MATPDLYSLLMAPDEGTAAERSAAMQAALRRDKALGTLGVLSGDAVLSKLGGQMTADATHGIDRIGTAQQQRLTNALGQQRLAQEGAARAQGFRLQAARQAMEVDRADREDTYRKQMLGLQHARLAKENGDWAFAPNPVSGAPGRFNKKTGTWEAVADGRAPGANGEPPALPPMKPQDLDHSTTAIGKDLEGPMSMEPDLVTLEKFTARTDIPGFGPVVGNALVPNRVAEWWDGPEAIEARQSAKRLMAGILKEQSGTGVSDTERDEAMRAMGLSPTASPAEFKKGVEALRGKWNKLVAGRKARYRPEAFAEWERRGGAIGARPAPTQPPNPAGGAIDPAAQKTSDHVAAYKAQLKPGEVLVKRGGKAVALDPGEALEPGDVRL